MLVKKKVSRKKNIVMGSIAGAIVLVTLILMFVLLLKPQSSTQKDAVSMEAAVPMSRIKTTFDTSILEDDRVKNLRQYGPAEVLVQQRGRKADPFQPF